VSSPAALQRPDISPAEKRIGELLLQEELLSIDQLEKALEEQSRTGTRLGYCVVAMGMVSESDLTRILSRQFQVPAVELSEIDVDPKILKLVPGEFASKNLVMPLRRVGRTLTVAMADPTDLNVVDDLKFITRFDIEPVVAGEYSLRQAIERHYDVATERLSGLLEEIEEQEIEVLEEEEEEEEFSASQLRAQVEDAPVVKLINGILTDAVRRGASDIHIEPYEKELRVRYRIDGTLQEIMKPPYRMKAALTSRVKILADLNIAERRVPQDGRIKMKIGDRVIDFRVSTLPVIHGEKLVLRILDKSSLRLDLEQFGMEPKAEKDFMGAITNPYGMILVTGPTGSGKTTTLYSALNKINNEDVNIMTAEDPVEYNLHGINQVQVRSEIGLSFASALKAFLRQDPDIIMVGEIRDTETGSIAIKAALTGHLVLSTLHTNDAASTITRMIDMGIEPFNVASAVTIITAQRLVRKICTNCKVETSYMPEYLEAAGLDPDRASQITFYEGEGCDACNDSGFSGRQGLYEVMPMNRTLRRMVLQGASSDDLKDQAIDDGMLTLRQDGLIKVRRGVTTLEEVLKETAA
jgi:type IV pilus assembly protein PilB